MAEPATRGWPRRRPRRILLVGMMGVGKTTVSRHLSLKLGWDELDTDAQVVATTGMTVPEIFERHGEPHFRSQETAVLRQAMTGPEHVVVAVAGGGVLADENRTLLSGGGVVVWLRARAETIIERLGEAGGRPLLRDDPTVLIRRYDEMRRPIYEALADVVVDVDDRRPEEVADQIVDGLGLAKGVPYEHGDELKRRVMGGLQRFERVAIDDGSKRRAAVALTIISRRGGDGAFVLTRRAAGLADHARQWALPGGKIDEGEDAATAALRELREEVGLELGDDSVLGLLDDYATRSGFVITPVVVWAPGAVTLTPNPQEVANVYRIGLHELEVSRAPRLVRIPESDKPVLQMPVRGTYINPPTAVVLYQFREVCLRARTVRIDGYDQPVFAWR